MERLCKDSPLFAVREYSSLKERFTLAGKCALVTGGAGSIGRSTAQAFAELGADVTLMDIPQKQAQLEELCERIMQRYPGRRAFWVTGDVSDQESVDAFVGEAAEKMGHINVLHNNAGIIIPGDHADIPIEVWNRLMRININGIMMVGRAVANRMIAQKTGGAIVNTASMSAHIINPHANENYGFSYCASKAAVLNMTKSMAANYIKYGIRVNSVSPGVVLSGIHDNYPESALVAASKAVPIHRFGYLDEIADVVAFLATEAASFMVGSDVLVDGGQCIN